MILRIFVVIMIYYLLILSTCFDATCDMFYVVNLQLHKCFTLRTHFMEHVKVTMWII